jgi:hypothetical protein
LALGSVETREARADAGAEVAQAAARAVSAGLISVAIKRISARGALLHVAGRAAVSGIAEAAHVLHGVPGGGVGAAGLGGQVLLGPAGAAVVAVIGAQGTLARYTIVSGEAVASTGGAVATTLVGALHPRVQVVGIYDISDPGEVLGASSLRAVRTSPLGLTI